MPYIPKKQVFHAKINEVEIGTGSASVKLGGNHALPFYSFDAPAEHTAKIGVEISDLALSTYTQPGLAEFYAGCESIADMAERASKIEGASFVALHFESADPNAADTSVEDCVALAASVADRITLPLAVMGCKDAEKDAELLKRVSEALAGRNILVLSAVEDNYTVVGPAAAINCGQKIGAESSVDINLAKQLSTVMTQMGVPAGEMVMQAGTAAAGYGFEYLASTLERIKAAALASGDVMLQMPIVTPVSTDAWGVKEAMATEEEMPEWGSAEERGIEMEITGASACLMCGSDAVIMRHPEAIKAVSDLINALS